LESPSKTEAQAPEERQKRKGADFRRKGREFAMQFLFQADHDDEHRNSAADMALFWSQFDELCPHPQGRRIEKARAFAERIILKAVENKPMIDAKIEQFAKNWRLERMGCVDRNVMRIAVTEMLFFDDIPPVVSINEAVETAKLFGSESSGSFVNGILNSVKDSLDRPAREPRGGG